VENRIRGMRVTVGMIVGQIGAGISIEELLSDYPNLERDYIMHDIRSGARVIVLSFCNSQSL